MLLTGQNSALSCLAWKTICRIMRIARENPLQLGLHHLEDPVAGGAAAEAGLPCKQTTQ